MKTSETLSELAGALALAQGEMEVAKKDNTNTFFAKGPSKSKYADINNVWLACRAALSKHGLAVLQAPSVTTERYLRMTTRLIHKSGEWVETELDFKPKEDTPQALGSCCTYARRYSLQSLVGVIAEEDDDDGNAASIGSGALKKHEENQQQQRPPQGQQQPPQQQKLPLFSAKEIKHAEWLEKALKEKNFDAQTQASILHALDGKPFNELANVIQHVTEGRQNG